MNNFFRSKPVFKLKGRQDLWIPTMLFGVNFLIILLFGGVLGVGNAMALGNCFFFVYLSLSNNYTGRFAHNLLYFSCVHVALGIAAYIANFNLLSKGLVFFIVVLFLAYSFNHGKSKVLYLQFTMSFIFFVYYPPGSGQRLIIRLIILEASVIIMMICQLIFNKKKKDDEKKELVEDILSSSSYIYTFSKTKFLYSLKTAIMSSLGLTIIAYIGLPYEYWYPINICILAQPFYEFNRTKSLHRILNTLLVTALLFIAFHLTPYFWLQIVIIIALLLLGDVFFKLNYMTTYAAFLAIIMGQNMGRGSIDDLSVLRLLYIVATSALILLVDTLISPRNIKTTFMSNMREVEENNHSIISCLQLYDGQNELLRWLLEKRITIDEKINNLRPYYGNPLLNEYAAIEEKIFVEYSLLNREEAKNKNGFNRDFTQLNKLIKSSKELVFNMKIGVSKEKTYENVKA